MPYIITVGPDGFDTRYHTRRAVAELFDARDEAAYQVEVTTGGDPDYEEIYTDAQGCSELGDTFGPLQDGTIVKVEPVEWSTLARLGEADTDDHDVILAAFNHD